MGPRIRNDEMRIDASSYAEIIYFLTRSLYIPGPLCRKLPAGNFRLLRRNEDEVVLEEFEGCALWEPPAPCFLLVIDILQILSHD